MKVRLVESTPQRIAKIESGDIKVVGQNWFVEGEDSPLTAGAEGGILVLDPEVERERREALEHWKSERDEAAVRRRWPTLPAPRRREREHDAVHDRRREGGRDDRRVGADPARRVRRLPRRRPGSGRGAGGNKESLADLRERVEGVADRSATG